MMWKPVIFFFVNRNLASERTTREIVIRIPRVAQKSLQTVTESGRARLFRLQNRPIDMLAEIQTLRIFS